MGLYHCVFWQIFLLWLFLLGSCPFRCLLRCPWEGETQIWPGDLRLAVFGGVFCFLVFMICQFTCDHLCPCCSFIYDSLFSCKDRALERDRPHQRGKKIPFLAVWSLVTAKHEALYITQVIEVGFCLSSKLSTQQFSMWMFGHPSWLLWFHGSWRAFEAAACVPSVMSQPQKQDCHTLQRVDLARPFLVSPAIKIEIENSLEMALSKAKSGSAWQSHFWQCGAL